MSGFRSSNRSNFFKKLLHLFIAAVLFVCVNIVSMRYFGRIGSTKNPKFCTSKKTLEIFQNLHSDAEIFFILEKNNELQKFDMVRDDIRHLIDKFLHVPCKKRISIEIIDAGENSKRYHDMCIKFGTVPKNCVVVAANNKINVVSIDELYKEKNGSAVAFVGESVIASKLNDLSSENKSVIYFTVGHGESEIDDMAESNGLSSLKNIMKQRNYDARPIDISDSKEVPKDASAIVIVGAKSEFFGFEKEILRDFVDTRDGNVIIALDSSETAGLTDFCNDSGIYVGNEQITSFNEKTLSFGGNIILKRYSQHEINDRLLEFRVPMTFGGAREVAVAKWVTDDDKVEVSELVQTDDNISVNGKKLPKEKIGKTVAAISERKKFGKSGTISKFGKLVVIGNTDFISNGKINFIGNRLFWIGMIDYLIGHEESDFDGDGIGADGYKIAITDKEMLSIFARSALLPISALMMFFVVSFIRRK